MKEMMFHTFLHLRMLMDIFAKNKNKNSTSPIYFQAHCTYFVMFFILLCITQVQVFLSGFKGVWFGG